MGSKFSDRLIRQATQRIHQAMLMKACCAADTQVMVLRASIMKHLPLKNSWYKYSGKIISYTYQDKQMPALEIENMISVAKPKDEYLYPVLSTVRIEPIDVTILL